MTRAAVSILLSILSILSILSMATPPPTMADSIAIVVVQAAGRVLSTDDLPQGTVVLVGVPPPPGMGIEVPVVIPTGEPHQTLSITLPANPFDAGQDGVIGLPEAIRALQFAAGVQEAQ